MGLGFVTCKVTTSPRIEQTQLSLFEIVYGQNPLRVLDLVAISRIGRLSIKADEMADYL
jgi:hypothetical protein